MTAQPQWGVNYINSIRTLVNAIEEARTQHDMLVQDPSLSQAYLNSPNARTDIKVADFTAADAAMVQILFTYDSGSPTQKSALYKML
jgi:hypothetical protein